jgi:uncharacterized protein (DUF1330 family)
MSAYIIVQVEIDDPVRYEDYKKLTPATIAQFGGQFVVRGGKAEVLEGPPNDSRIVVVEFPDAARARAWWSSPEYAPAKALRQSCSRAKLLLVEGV